MNKSGFAMLFYFAGVFAVSFLVWWVALSLIGFWAFAILVPGLILLWYKTLSFPVQLLSNTTGKRKYAPKQEEKVSPSEIYDNVVRLYTSSTHRKEVFAWLSGATFTLSTRGKSYPFTLKLRREVMLMGRENFLEYAKKELHKCDEVNLYV